MADASVATLEVNLNAIAANYGLLKERHAKKAIAAVVKANAYGLGLQPVAKALYDAGCLYFFVATLEEGIELRGYLPKATIAVFHGLQDGEEKEFLKHRLLPVLNDLGQAQRFNSTLQGNGAILHVDTGILRLGFDERDLGRLLESSIIPNFSLVMSHLACASEPEHPRNAQQLKRFQEALAHFPGVKASLANSSGLFLSPDYHFDLGRPGCALYGIHPAGQQNPMQHVATLSAPILQVRTLARDETVGYGATYAAKAGSRIAVVGLGYADGYLRHLSNKGMAYVRGYKVPVVGRVSMDMITLNVTSVPEMMLTPGTRAEFINATQTVNDVAETAGTIGYEIFTRIGRRVRRLYS